MPTALVPGIYDPDVADVHTTVATEDAQAMTRALARYEGILAGPSGGAGVLAAVRLAQTLPAGTVVTILPDGGNRYLSDRFWEESEA
jgi:cysteine synthase B